MNAEITHAKEESPLRKKRLQPKAGKRFVSIMENSNAVPIQRLVKVLNELSGKMDNINTSPTSQSSATKSDRIGRRKKLPVSSECSNATRDVYKTLLKGDVTFGYNLGKEVSFHGTENELTTKRITRGVRDAYGGKEKCPFSTAEIEGACQRYFKSLRDSERRKEKGTNQRHAVTSRRQSRRRERCIRLQKAIKTASFTSLAKEKVRPLLTPDYMSSEESDIENGERTSKVRHLSWQKKKFRKAKEVLEEEYERTLPIHLKGNKRKRVQLEIPSRRKPPASCPSWVIRSSWRDSAEEEEEEEQGDIS
ncbi:uncharacterized protein LOC133175156 [Saccostrea echinata]|uniref:uncharacterized protein LOC133175156 n=1 Tax=Saccostrea echinata TaxID=191078 RepID=UPI002A7F240F|nr:uncharacterized protein LOC133175156 [Saccostrea echinata]